MPPRTPDQEPRRGLRVSSEELDRMLTGLDQAQADYPDSRRQYKRYQFRKKECRVRIWFPGESSPRVFLMDTRNLSVRGVSLLHGGFVHIGSRCAVDLPALRGESVAIEGRVTACRYLQSGVHEICLNFNRDVPVADHCPASTANSLLLVSDDITSARLISHMLETRNNIVHRATDAKSALDLVAKQKFDCVLLDLESIVNAVESVKALRQGGFVGGVCALSAKPESGERDAESLEAFDRILTKPVSADALAEAVASLIPEPIPSSLRGDQSLHQLISDFVDRLPGEIQSIRDAVTDNKIDSLLSLTRLLKGRAGSYGYASIAEVAQGLEELASKSEPLEHLTKQLEQLTQLCLRARV